MMKYNLLTYLLTYLAEKINIAFSRLLLISQWPYDNSRSRTNDVQLHIASTNEPKNPQ